MKDQFGRHTFIKDKNIKLSLIDKNNVSASKKYLKANLNPKILKILV